MSLSKWVAIVTLVLFLVFAPVLPLVVAIDCVGIAVAITVAFVVAVQTVAFVVHASVMLLLRTDDFDHEWCAAYASWLNEMADKEANDLAAIAAATARPAPPVWPDRALDLDEYDF